VVEAPLRGDFTLDVDATLAAAEQLEAHRRAVTLRLAALDERAEVSAA